MKLDPTLQQWLKEFAMGPSAVAPLQTSPEIRRRRLQEIQFLQSLLPKKKRISASHLKKWPYIDLISYKLYLREKISLSNRLPIGFSETRISSPSSVQLPNPVQLQYDYQRNGLLLKSKNPFRDIYFGTKARSTWKSRGVFTNGCQAAVATLLQNLRWENSKTRVVYPEEPYWESMGLLQELRFSAKCSESVKDMKGSVLFFDSSTEIKGKKWELSRGALPRWLLVDTSCWPQGSPRLEELISTALKKAIPVLLVRSHMKLDSLGIEYNRLGSAVMLWDENFSKKKQAELLKFWSHFEKLVRMLGAGSQLSQWYPFLQSPQFHRLNEQRIQDLKRSTHTVAKALETDGNDKVKVLRFEHDLFFLVTIAKKLSFEEIRVLAVSLLSLCQMQGLPLRWVASYGWDFIAMTAFDAQTRFFPQAESTFFRFSIPDLDSDTQQLFIKTMKIWLQSLRRDF